MKKTLLLGLLFMFSSNTDAESLGDYFPLSTGNQWTYRYTATEKRYDGLFLLKLTTDSGVVQYKLLSESRGDSAIVWNVEEIDSIYTHILGYLYEQKDTSFYTKTISQFQLRESLDSLHTLTSVAKYPVFTFPIQYFNIQNNPIYRYHADGIDHLVAESRTFVYTLADTLIFKKNKGLANARSSVVKGPTTPYYFNWEASLISSVTGIASAKPDRVEQFYLFPNYPNPFNPSTTISFNIPSKSHVSLKIFDVMGRDVATIVSDELSAGNYQRQWNASTFPSGMYFYRLQAGSYTETKRLLLIR